MRARRLQEAGDDEGAIGAYLIAKGMLNGANNNDMGTDPRLPLARLYTKCARYSEAESEYQGLMSYGGPTIKYEYGQFLMQQGKFSTAISIWTDLLGQNPKDPIAMYGMGLALEATENPDSAKDYYQRVVSVAPNSEQAANASRKLDRLGTAIEKRDSGTFFPVDPEYGQAGLGWWNLKTMPIHVYIDDGTGVKGYRSEMKSFIYRAMESWRQASGGKIYFVVDPPDPRGELGWKEVFGKKDALIKMQEDEYKLPDDPIKTGIHVHWTESLGGVALGLAWTNPFANKADKDGNKNCLITNGHIWLNTNSLADGTPIPKIGAANIAILEKQNRVVSEVAIHEFGHTLGLMHSSNSRDIMCSGIFSMNSSDLVDGRNLSVGDLGSLAEHYNNFEGMGFPSSLIVKEGTGGAATVAASSQSTSSGSTSSASPVAVVASSSPGGSSQVLAGAGASGAQIPGNVLFTKLSPQAEAQAKAEKEIAAVVFDISTKRYTDGLSKVDKILESQASNANARYLRAVILVYLKNYKEAEKDYLLVIKQSPGSQLAKRASDGLSKIKTP